MAQPQFRWLSDDAGELNTRGWPNTSTTESPSQPVVASQEYGTKAKAVGYSLRSQLQKPGTQLRKLLHRATFRLLGNLLKTTNKQQKSHLMLRWLLRGW